MATDVFVGLLRAVQKVITVCSDSAPVWTRAVRKIPVHYLRFFHVNRVDSDFTRQLIEGS